jgi:hypothetical protein
MTPNESKKVREKQREASIKVDHRVQGNQSKEYPFIETVRPKLRNLIAIVILLNSFDESHDGKRSLEAAPNKKS